MQIFFRDEQLHVHVLGVQKQALNKSETTEKSATICIWQWDYTDFVKTLIYPYLPLLYLQKKK